MARSNPAASRNRSSYKPATSRKCSSYKTAASSRKSVSSKRSTGCYTSKGAAVRNPIAYASTKTPVYNSSGKKINNPTNYSAAVQTNAIKSAARTIVKKNPNAKAFTYTLSLPKQKKYVGYTTNPAQRLGAHLSGSGAKCVRDNPQAVTITPHTSVAAAKKAETKQYFEQKERFGGNRVRGAGHTRLF